MDLPYTKPRPFSFRTETRLEGTVTNTFRVNHPIYSASDDTTVIDTLVIELVTRNFEQVRVVLSVKMKRALDYELARQHFNQLMKSDELLMIKVSTEPASYDVYVTRPPSTS